MSDIYTILKISKDSLLDFPILANRVADRQTERIIDTNIQRLERIEESNLGNHDVSIPQKSIDDVIKRVEEFSKDENRFTLEWKSFEIRIITYYLSQIEESGLDAFEYALDLIDFNWRNSYFMGLVFYIMNGWNCIDPEYRDIACKLLINKLKSYKDKNSRYLRLKECTDYFDDNGPLRLATLFGMKGKSLMECPSVFGLKTSSLSFSYFSDVIIRYYSKKTITDYSELEDVLEKHNMDRTSKLVYAKLVEKVDTDGDEFQQNNLSKSVNRVLGDITKPLTWYPFENATEEEKALLENAKILVNRWFARKVIESFFEVCVQDYSRKSFWLNYVNYVKDFRVAGSSSVKHTLMSDDRISSSIGNFFIETNSRYNQTAALILFIKDKVMVEFSDLGSLYVYNEGHQMISFIRKGIKHIDSINDLKSPYFSSLVETSYGYHYFNDEGKMRHAGEWQTRLRRWMERLLDITPNLNYLFNL